MEQQNEMQGPEEYEEDQTEDEGAEKGELVTELRLVKVGGVGEGGGGREQRG